MSSLHRSQQYVHLCSTPAYLCSLNLASSVVATHVFLCPILRLSPDFTLNYAGTKHDVRQPFTTTLMALYDKLPIPSYLL